MSREIDQVLILLRNQIRERGFTQLQVQQPLGWGRSAISQILTKQKTLHVEHLLLVLGVIGVEPVEFFGELYRWSGAGDRGSAPQSPPASSPDSVAALRTQVDREIDRVLGLLREKIRAGGLTQLEIQESLGWGRSHVSQLLTKQKGLRLEQVLMILGAVGVDPSDFFAELYLPEEERRAHRVVGGEEHQLSNLVREQRETRALLSSLLALLVEKGLVSEEELRATRSEEAQR